ncbi:MULTISPECIES: hypothetical protein [unclassified Caldicellulosiruptor]|uniref:hypothetical protein n=1 Tax=unclassified Caldicellulosiruptor TaxID=2622462 RepID=UPI0003A845AB|nr:MULTISPECIES: hypothetical protein [unclassified Caldicellulosiruptor]
MNRKNRTLIFLLLVFLLSLSIASAKFYFSNNKNISLNNSNIAYADIEKNKDSNGEQTQIVDENLKKDFDILLKSDNFMINYKIPSEISPIDFEKYFLDKKPKNLYRLIMSYCLSMKDRYAYLDYETKQTYKKSYEEYLKENQNNLYNIEEYAQYKIDKVAIYYYEKFLRELIKKPYDWQNIWKEFRTIAIEHKARKDIYMIDPDFKKSLLFLTPEGKEIAKQNNITEEQIEKEREEYQKILEQKKQEIAEQLDKWARQNGIIE